MADDPMIAAWHQVRLTGTAAGRRRVWVRDTPLFDVANAEALRELGLRLVALADGWQALTVEEANSVRWLVSWDQFCPVLADDHAERTSGVDPLDADGEPVPTI
jgi:hypothetical protein